MHEKNIEESNVGNCEIVLYTLLSIKTEFARMCIFD